MDATELTILLPLKGRHLHTLRFLWYANRLRLPYRFLVADGEVHPTIARLLENSGGTFPHLDIEYVRYPDDTSYRHYCRKMADASTRVRTRYVMHADNDDFLLPAGIGHCIRFLESHRDYVCCRGGVGGFELAPHPASGLSGVLGPFKRLESRYGKYYGGGDLGDEAAAQRIRAGFGQEYISNFYNVFRSDALGVVWQEIVALNLEGLRFIEPYFAMRTFTAGKVRAEKGVLSYLRQHGTSMAAGRSFRWARDIFSSSYVRDYKVAIAGLAQVVAKADNIDLALAEAHVREAYDAFYEARVSRKYGKFRRSIRKRLDRIRGGGRKARNSDVQPRRLRNPSAGREELFVSLLEDGATEPYAAALREELAAVEATLTGNEFLEFVGACAPEFLPPAEGLRA